MDLTLNVYSDDPGYTVIAVSGEIDVYTAPKLREKLITLVEDGSYKLIVDMEGVEFLDSTGLGVLVGGLKRVRAHDGWIDLVCTQSRILRIFKITGLNKVFSIHNSVAEAAAAHTPEEPEEEALPQHQPERSRAPLLPAAGSRVERAQHQARARLRAE